MKKNFCMALLLFLLLFSCSNNGDDKANVNSKKNINKDSLNERLISANKIFVGTENEMIDDFIKRYNWDMKITSSGLRYNIYKKNAGEMPKLDNKITIAFTTKLLNGSVIYSSKENGYKVFTLGRAEVEKGLEEGVMMMCEGEKAKFIIPSYLAYGLIGDQNKIPRNATLIYDVELIKIEKKQFK